jgi:hypothetical protein
VPYDFHRLKIRANVERCKTPVYRLPAILYFLAFSAQKIDPNISKGQLFGGWGAGTPLAPQRYNIARVVVAEGKGQENNWSTRSSSKRVGVMPHHVNPQGESPDRVCVRKVSQSTRSLGQVC